MKKRKLEERIDKLERQVAELEAELEGLTWVVPCVPLAPVYPARHVPPACRRWYPDWTWYPTTICATNVVEGGVW